VPSNIINSEKPKKKPLFKDIRSIQGKTKILTDYPTYLMDESKLNGTADWLFFPKSEAEILTIVDFQQKNKIRMYVSAARTGIVGACVPISGSILSTEKMNKIIGLGFDKKKSNFFIRVEPGITLKEINDRLMKKELGNVSELTPRAIENFKEKKQTFHYPVDPTEMSATIGGTVATNASGARTLKYGPTREWIKRLRVVLCSGDILDIQRGENIASREGIFIINKADGGILQFKIPNYVFNTSVKNTAGIYSKPNMDLIDLFIGSEGILGIITQIDIWIIEKKDVISNVLFFNSEEDSISFVELIRSNSIVSPEFIEFFSSEALNLLRNVQKKDSSSINVPQIPPNSKSAIFFDVPYAEEKLDTIFTEISKIAKKCNTNLSSSWSGYENREITRLKDFRHLLPENVNAIIALRKQKFPQLHKLGTDICVPDKFFRKMMTFYRSLLLEANLDFVIFGHIGENHVHVNILPKNLEELQLGEKIYEKFAREAVENNGTISAEHGVGKIKIEYLKIMYSQNDLDEMRLIKKRLDPLLILNHGNIVNFNFERE
ncbi:MAG: FAD-binding oxidoreductase, partial [Promethearchaeota archaeon]|jgi:D-lactate dehydrogenase (cytochrome)